MAENYIIKNKKRIDVCNKIFKHLLCYREMPLQNFYSDNSYKAYRFVNFHFFTIPLKYPIKGIYFFLQNGYCTPLYSVKTYVHLKSNCFLR